MLPIAVGKKCKYSTLCKFLTLASLTYLIYIHSKGPILAKPKYPKAIPSDVEIPEKNKIDFTILKDIAKNNKLRNCSLKRSSFLINKK
tara:strand:+ start:4931 stop:5194 length:264 start_codon:yes stop_codon:yes gene_type:complete